MKTTPSKIFAFTLLLFIVSCSRNESMKEMRDKSAQESADTVTTGLTSSSAAVETGDPDRKFIRTADLKFKVKSVVNTTYRIEEIITRMGGFVTLTNLNSEKGQTDITPISEDSSLETTWFTVTNTMVIRVPNTALDSTLKAIAPLIDFLDYRIIKADDVGLQLLANQLAQKRAAKHEQRLTDAIDNRGRKLRETTNAEELLLSQQEQADNAKLHNLSLMDQVQYSTINVLLYQKQTVKREMVYNYKNIEAYKPGLGTKLAESFSRGWDMITAFFVFLTGLWAFILLGVIIYVLYKRFGHLLRK